MSVEQRLRASYRRADRLALLTGSRKYQLLAAVLITTGAGYGINVIF